jgi:hypothetical protein
MSPVDGGVAQRPEQGTHKPLVGGSSPPAAIFFMANSPSDPKEGLCCYEESIVSSIERR